MVKMYIKSWNIFITICTVNHEVIAMIDYSIFIGLVTDLFF